MKKLQVAGYGFRVKIQDIRKGFKLQKQYRVSSIEYIVKKGKDKIQVSGCRLRVSGKNTRYKIRCEIK